MRRVARLLSYGGSAATVLFLSVYHGRYVADITYDFTNSSRFTWAIGYTVLLELTSYSVGMPDQPRSTRQAFYLSSIAVGVAVVGVSIPQLITGDAFLPRFVVFGAAFIIIPWQVTLNVMSRGRTRRAQNRDRVLLVAQAGEEERFRNDLSLSPEKAAQLVGHLTPEDARGTGGTGRVLAETAERVGATVVVMDTHAQADDRVITQAGELHESGVRLRTLQGFYEEWLGKLPISELERASLFFDIGEVHRIYYGRLKRMMDLIIALLALVPLLVVTPLVLFGNVLGNRGSLMYRQPRVGKGGSEFTIFKFRTMTDRPRRSAPSIGMREDLTGSSENVDALMPSGAVRGSDAPTSTWTQENDPRITPFGRLLRHSHLDELPQVINILKGDLSIVGPRPEQPHYVQELSAKLAFYDMRHLVRPGLTGWAQVKYGYAGDERDALEKLQYEFYYLRNQSLGFDNRIILRTLRAMIGGQGSGR
jgi:lipopolysaccharide/colanic/teichoic acid biosynthesis glycosyltransferase